MSLEHYVLIEEGQASGPRLVRGEGHQRGERGEGSPGRVGGGDGSRDQAKQQGWVRTAQPLQPTGRKPAAARPLPGRYGLRPNLVTA